MSIHKVWGFSFKKFFSRPVLGGGGSDRRCDCHHTHKTVLDHPLQYKPIETEQQSIYKPILSNRNKSIFFHFITGDARFLCLRPTPTAPRDRTQPSLPDEGTGTGKVTGTGKFSVTGTSDSTASFSRKGLRNGGVHSVARPVLHCIAART